jgi:hypothetical protein
MRWDVQGERAIHAMSEAELGVVEIVVTETNSTQTLGMAVTMEP